MPCRRAVSPRVRLQNYGNIHHLDKLPEAVTYLTALVTSLLGELRELRNALSPPPQVAPEFISTKEACALLGECKEHSL